MSECAHVYVCLCSIYRYRIITFQLSLTQESRGLGAHTQKKREISKRAGDWAGVIQKGNYC